MADTTCPNCDDQQKRVDQLRWTLLNAATQLEEWSAQMQRFKMVPEPGSLWKKAEDLREAAARK